MATLQIDMSSSEHYLTVNDAVRRAAEEKYQRRQRLAHNHFFLASLNDRKDFSTRRYSAPLQKLPYEWSSDSRRSSIQSFSDRSVVSSVSNVSSVTSTSRSSGTASKRSSLSSFDAALSSFSYSKPFTNSIFTSPAPPKSPWELDRTRRSIILEGLLNLRDHFIPARIFASLPPEVYDCILFQLRYLHLPKNEPGCVECYMSDLKRIALVSRAWHKAAERNLYRVLTISNSYLQLGKKVFRPKTMGRLKSLRKKLRERPDLAGMVKVIQITPDVADYYHQASREEKAPLESVLASLIMSCPNLERWEGLCPVYKFDHDSLAHALSTRSKLRERIWDFGLERTLQTELPFSKPIEVFLQQSDNWGSSLKRLVLHGSGVDGCLDYRGFVATFRKLENLRDLVISNFSDLDFDDRTVSALPAIDAVRLENLPGVSDKGLLRYSRSISASTVRSLALVDIGVSHLDTLKVLLALPLLQHFAFQQDLSPAVPFTLNEPGPLFESPSLEYLHWDIASPGDAHYLLAEAIHNGDFPMLRNIRCPNDHAGALQCFCRPVATITQDCDNRLVKLSSPAHQPSTRSLATARRAAQRRIEEARNRDAFTVVVDLGGKMQESFSIKGFMGTVGSKINYTLDPDVPGSDTALAPIEELLDGWNRRDMGQKIPCAGGATGSLPHKPRTKVWRIESSDCL